MVIMWKKIHECIAELMGIEEVKSDDDEEGIHVESQAWELLVSRLLSEARRAASSRLHEEEQHHEEASDSDVL